MRDVNTIDDIYPAIRELIAELQKAGLEKAASILTHRMTKVAWTSRNELFEELMKTLTTIGIEHKSALTTPLKNQIQLILQMLQKIV